MFPCNSSNHCLETALPLPWLWDGIDMFSPYFYYYNKSSSVSSILRLYKPLCTSTLSLSLSYALASIMRPRSGHPSEGSDATWSSIYISLSLLNPRCPQTSKTNHSHLNPDKSTKSFMIDNKLLSSMFTENKNWNISLNMSKTHQTDQRESITFRNP
jgi:hypothetical protein